jgi:alanyl-tRNA synthetase
LVKKLYSSTPTISDSTAFKLYDTYGFPIDLTVQMAEERGLKVDVAGFEKLMEAAKERSRAVDTKEGERALTLSGDEVARLRRLGVEPTNDAPKFDGHDLLAHVKAIWNGENFDEHSRVQIGKGRTVGIVTDRTCFYATMGGQDGDHGKIVLANPAKSGGERPPGGVFIVESTQAFGGYVLHIGHMKEGELRTGDSVTMQLDKARRARIMANHTATHLTNLGLRAALGDGVDQKGSLVAPDRFRFDFSHGQPVAPEELRKVEEVVRGAIEKNLNVYAEAAPLAAAKQVAGVRAVFGETYPDPVRVVSIGAPVRDLLAKPDEDDWREYSVEFCGGTHVSSTGAIGAFAIVSEEAVAKGVRRVTGLSGEAAREAQRAADACEAAVARAAAGSDAQLPALVQGLLADLDAKVMPSWRKASIRASVTSLQDRLKAAEKALAGVAREAAVKHARAVAASAQTANDLVIVNTVPAGEDRAALQAAVKTVRDTCPRSAVMLFSIDAAGKVGVCAGVPEGLVQKGLKAGDWLRDACAVLGGKGGGKPDSAMGGGPDAAKVPEAIQAARTSALRAVM